MEAVLHFFGSARSRAFSLLSVLVALATVVAGLATPVAAEPADSGVVGDGRIVHAPTTTSNYGQPIPLTAKTRCVDAAGCDLTLYARTTPTALLDTYNTLGNGWTYAIPMTVTGATATPDGALLVDWSGTIPGQAVTTAGVDYFLQLVHDGRIESLPPPSWSTLDSTLSGHNYFHVHTVNPPLLAHTPPAFAYADDPLPLQLEATCSAAPTSCVATMYYRTTASAAHGSLPAEQWPNVQMQRTVGDALPGGGGRRLTFAATIPASFVDTRGVDYVFHVTDGHTNAWWPGTTYQGYYAPTDGQRAEHHHVHVVEQPHIVHAPTATAAYRSTIPLRIQANCAAERACTATMSYRTTKRTVLEPDDDFTTVPMQLSERAAVNAELDLLTFDATVPSTVTDTRGVDYFFTTTDGSTTAYWPGTSHVDGYVTAEGTRVAYHHVRVLEPPHISHAPIGATQAFKDVVVTADITCVTEHCTAELSHTRATATVGGRAFSTQPMATVGAPTATAIGKVQRYTATIPADDVTTSGLAYFIEARDGYTRSYAPGTSYWGAYVPVDGQRGDGSAAGGDATVSSGETSVTVNGNNGDPMNTGAAFPVRVLEPPHAVHAPVLTSTRHKAITIDVRSNCSTGECAGVVRILNGTEWHVEPLVTTAVTAVNGNEQLVEYRGTIPSQFTGGTALSYQVELFDGYADDTLPAIPVTLKDAATRVVRGRMWFDRDSNGNFDDENSLTGKTMELTWAGIDGLFGGLDDLVFTKATTPGGDYWFGGVPEGNYRLRPAAGSMPPHTSLGPNALQRSFTLTGSVTRVEQYPVRASDVDNDGVLDLVEVAFGISPGSVDTDADGLRDKYEIEMTGGLGKPGVADTDGDGTSDAVEDFDEDGLSSLTEQTLGGTPVAEDTDKDGVPDALEATNGTSLVLGDEDGDGLDDLGELRAGTNAHVADTDGDGILDRDDAATIAMPGPEGATVTVRGPAEIAGELAIHSLEDAGGRFNDAPGQVGDAIDITLPEEHMEAMTSADVTFSYDPAVIGASAADLRVFWYDEDRELWVPAAATQSVDTVNHKVTATVDHFSVYALFNIRNWETHYRAVTGTCTPGGTGQPLFVDIALSIDSSGSMLGNDPNGLRRDAAKRFVDAMFAEDRGAVIDFDNYAYPRQQLTSDKLALHNAINTIDDSGGTDIGAGVDAALDELDRGRIFGRGQFAVLLTDGVGPYDQALTQRAIDANIPVYTISLGGGIDAELLAQIAADTGGDYHHVDDADDLPEVFRLVAKDLGDDRRDTDDDGISDCDEEWGFVDASMLVPFFTNPLVADTDGDGLTDGFEAGTPRSWADLGLGNGRYYPLHSNPMEADSDGDWLDDGNEQELGSKAWVQDTDGDVMNDHVEKLHNSDPLADDTDGDGFEDHEDMLGQHDQRGLTPIEHDVILTPREWLTEYARGAGFGDVGDADTVPELIGNIAGGIAAPGVADVRDLVGNMAKGDVVGAAFSALGIVPIAGDTVASVNKVRKFVTRHIDKCDEVLAAIFDSSKIPASVKRQILRAVRGAEVRKLKGAGMTDQVIERLVRGRKNLKHMAEFAEKARIPAKSPDGFMVNWQSGERFLRDTRNYSNVGPRGRGFADPVNAGSRRNYRIVDSWDPVNKIARESKVGYQGTRVDSRKKLIRQIEKDRQLLDNDDFAKVEWHFFASDGSQSIGAHPEIIDKLDELEIPYFIHAPTSASSQAWILPS